jgi:transposase
MITQLLETLRIERLDDIPLLLAQLQRMQLARLLDQHYPTDPHWAGQLTFGEVAAVWLAQLVSTGDHRLCQLEGWAAQRLDMLSACLGKPVRALDFHDDRLADMLDALADADTWATFEQELNASLVRVYQLPTASVRVDTTTARTFATTDADHHLFQFGHSKDHRPDLPQIKVALATLDPLGMPLVTAVVPGNTADDPLYVPVIQQVQQSLGTGPRLLVGDCKMAALQTRAYIAQSGDYYLCPLSATQVPPAQWQQLLEPVWSGTQELLPVYQSGSSGTLIATGFWKLVPQRATCAVTGREVFWYEQQLMVRSVAHAARHAAVVDAKLTKAQAALLALNERKRGKKRLTDEGLRSRAAELVQQHGVADLLDVQVQTRTRKVAQRKYKARAAGVRVVTEATVRVAMNTAAIEAKKRLGGWRVYVTNGMQLTMQVAVQAYRGQYGVEHGFSRLKGKTLQLTPLYLQSEARVEGLVHLLSVGLRLLSLIEYGVRQGLSQSKEKLRGIYPGQKGRGTLTPSAELLLGAFRGLDLRIVVKSRKRHRSVGCLNAVQKRILELLDLPVTVYHGLGGSFSGSG